MIHLHNRSVVPCQLCLFTTLSVVYPFSCYDQTRLDLPSVSSQDSSQSLGGPKEGGFHVPHFSVGVEHGPLNCLTPFGPISAPFMFRHWVSKNLVFLAYVTTGVDEGCFVLNLLKLGVNILSVVSSQSSFLAIGFSKHPSFSPTNLH